MTPTEQLSIVFIIDTVIAVISIIVIMIIPNPFYLFPLVILTIITMYFINAIYIPDEFGDKYVYFPIGMTLVIIFGLSAILGLGQPQNVTFVCQSSIHIQTILYQNGSSISKPIQSLSNATSWWHGKWVCP